MTLRADRLSLSQTMIGVSLARTENGYFEFLSFNVFGKSAIN
jgi:hypothetical protein